ncbi:F-box/LRR-repeat protein At3g58930-like [Brassica napus]|uniref:(rape) hypothetical protein n=1 Tax=Brassica napus TaxID=3708 RepID=A0A816JFL1_BRANA|nr:F-box/LRR-repeat protein At3g58930-like [Brassica napus]CAF1860706.1 unnamed protein product [Brassica napus]
MDRISSLPDELLCHVLSFLPTKNAALTSVLSKSWLNLWKLVPNNIHIDDSLFLHPQDGKGEREEMQRSFVDFVDRVLAMQGDSPINNFSLKCISGRVHPDTVNRWICNVLERGVSDLNLFTDFSYEDTEEDGYRLPRELFFSSTLVKLKLRSEHCVDWWWRRWFICSSFFSLPMLKSFDIDSELVLCGEIEDFIPSFPVLEELRMATVEGTICDSVKCNPQKANPQCCDSMPVFNNLKFLSVTSEEGRGWQAMPALLRNCPHLETIIIQGLLHYVTDECGDACPFISREDRGRSLRSCPVKRLEIQGFRGTMKEMNMIKHFLDYFPCLKRLDVFVEDNDPTQLRNDQVSELVIEMFELYSKLWPSFNVKLLVSDFLDEKWTAQGHI